MVLVLSVVLHQPVQHHHLVGAIVQPKFEGRLRQTTTRHDPAQALPRSVTLRPPTSRATAVASSRRPCRCRREKDRTESNPRSRSERRRRRQDGRASAATDASATSVTEQATGQVRWGRLDSGKERVIVRAGHQQFHSLSFETGRHFHLEDSRHEHHPSGRVGRFGASLVRARATSGDQRSLLPQRQTRVARTFGYRTQGHHRWRHRAEEGKDCPGELTGLSWPRS